MLREEKPIQVVRISNRISEVDEDALSSILLDSRVRDNKVMVVSVVGVAEEGRTLFLNSFLEFLNSSADEQWMDRLFTKEPHGCLYCGYPWNHDGVKTGIYLWSEPFLTTLPSGEHVYVLLAETRGLFGNISNDSLELEPESFCRIKRHSRNISFDAFGLSAFLSSVLIYNVKADIRSHFHDLQMLTEYARMSLENCTDQPFQNLHFVVQDWDSPEMFPFGDEGGMQLLECRKKEAQEEYSISPDSTKRFENVKCFLMPKITENDNLSVVKPDFKSNLRTFIESLFAKNNIEVKTIEGKKATGSELMKYFKLYAKNFSEHKLRTLSKEKDSYWKSKFISNSQASIPTTWGGTYRNWKFIFGRQAPNSSWETLTDEVVIVERIVSFYSWEISKNTILNKIDFDELHNKCHEEALRMFRASCPEPEGRSTMGEKRLKKILDGWREEDYNKFRDDVRDKSRKSYDISLNHYITKMYQRNGAVMPYTLPLLLEQDHCRFLFEAINMFRSFEYHGSEEMQMDDEAELEEKICKMYDICKRLNEAKIKYNFRNGFESPYLAYDLIKMTTFDEHANKFNEGHLKVD